MCWVFVIPSGFLIIDKFILVRCRAVIADATDKGDVEALEHDVAAHVVRIRSLDWVVVRISLDLKEMLRFKNFSKWIVQPNLKFKLDGFSFYTFITWSCVSPL